MDTQKLVETVSTFSIPYLAAFTQLPIFFKKWKAIYVVIASLIACSFYAFIRYTDPNLIFLQLGHWWIFLIAAFVLIIAYIFLFNKHGESPANKNIPVTGLIIFVFLYTSIVVSFSLLFQSFDYQLVKGKIVQEDDTPIKGATITLYFQGENEEFADIPLGKKTNSSGISQRYILKDRLEKLHYYAVFHTDYINIDKADITLGDLVNLQSIILKK